MVGPKGSDGTKGVKGTSVSFYAPNSPLVSVAADVMLLSAVGRWWCVGRSRTSWRAWEQGEILLC